METLREQASPFSVQDSPLLKHISSQPEETGFICFLSSLNPKAHCDNGAKLLHGLWIPLGPEETVSFFLTSPHTSDLSATR